MKVCASCGEEKDEEDFNWRYKDQGIRHPTCRDCHKIHRDNWYQKHHEQELERVRISKNSRKIEAREFVYDYLSEHPCSSCGESDPRVLEFHHTGKKERTVASLISGGYSLERIQTEIDETEVLCANCHQRVTAYEKGWYKNR